MTKRQVYEMVASIVMNELRPFCDRIQIAGSLRRKVEDPGDIEILCIPKTEAIARPTQGSLFQPVVTHEPAMERVLGFARIVDRWVFSRGDALAGKYMQRIIPLNFYGNHEPIKIDVFTATPESWGLQLLIRTGSAEFSKRMAGIWVEQGYISIGGILHYGPTPNPLYEEEDVFEFLKCRYVKPEERQFFPYTPRV